VQPASTDKVAMMETEEKTIRMNPGCLEAVGCTIGIAMLISVKKLLS
jgi:hypothetical protein